MMMLMTWQASRSELNRVLVTLGSCLGHAVSSVKEDGCVRGRYQVYGGGGETKN